jgi:serine/threonine-protein kinase
MREQSLFIEALEHEDPAQRATFLDLACAGDLALRLRVERLLQRHLESGSFLDVQAATVDAPVRERPGTTVGPYKLLEQIGEGGFGCVFMAEQTRPVRRKVALKVLKPGMDSAQVVARFEQERQALALMDHPNIAQVFDGGEATSGRPYFVMELVKGVPITAFCDQGHLSVRDRLGLFVAVCGAVQHAHQKGVIHRDLKPSNVLVTSHDGVPVVKVIDFGIAKAIGQQLTDRTLFTGFTQMIGTPLYMSPEQAGQSGLDVDTRSDVYALGVLLYELLTGTTPFDKERLRGAGYDEMRRIIREEEPAKPSTRISTLGEAAVNLSANRRSDPKKLVRCLRGELDWVVMKALEKDRNRRYDTSSALALDVQRHLADEPVLACPPSAGYRLRKFVQRNRRALLTATVLGLAVLLAVGTTAGSVGWFLQERAARRTRTTRDVEAALEKVALFQEEGKYPEALAAASEAEGLLAAGDAAEEFQERVRQVRTDLRTVALLERARLGKAENKGSHFHYQAADPLYREAFAAQGLDLKFAPQQAADRIRGSAIRGQLVAALDDWVFAVAPERDRDRLLAVVRLADDDGWRNRFRALHQGRDRKELERLARQPDVQTQQPPTLVLLGGALFEAGAEEAAVEVLRQATRRHPGDLWLNNELGYVLLHGKRPRPGEAVGYLQAALAIRPEVSGLHNNLAMALSHVGRYAEAATHLRRATELNKDYLEAYRGLGVMLMRQGKMAAAAAQFRHVLARMPKHAWAHFNLGEVLLEQERYAEAANEFRRALELFDEAMRRHPENQEGIRQHPEGLADAHARLGTALVLQKRWAEAVPHLQKADPAWDAEALYYLGNALQELGRAPEAVAAYRKSLAIRPALAPQVNLGNALKSLRRLPEAAQAYRKALERAPDCAEAHCNLSAVLNDLGRHGEAVAHGRRAVALKPGDATAHYNLGIALSNQGEFGAAAAAHRRVIRLDPGYAEAHCNLGGLLQRQGHFVEALAAYRRGHQAGGKSPGWPYPSERWVKECERLVELDGLLAGVLRGAAPPAAANDRCGVAQFALDYKRLSVTAARLYASALADFPRLAEDGKTPHRYNAGCAAALAGTGQGPEATRLDEGDRARWRKQALAWLRASLALWARQVEKGPPARRAAIHKQLEHWQKDADLAGVRETAALARLPKAERDAWLDLWADVAALRARAQPQAKETRPQGP